MEEPSGLPMVYQGDTEAKRELIFIYGTYALHIENIWKIVATLGKKLSEHTLTWIETKENLIRIEDKMESLVTLLGQASAIYNELAMHIKEKDSIQYKWGENQLLYHHIQGTNTLIKHHLTR